MNARTDILQELSDALVARAGEAQGRVVAVRGRHRHTTGILWQDGVVLVSEQSLPRGETFEIATHTGETLKSTLAGRDKGSDIAVLKLEGAAPARPFTPAAARVGALVAIYGATREGGIASRLAGVRALGPEWHSRAGGRIESRIALDATLSSTEDGAAAFDMAGGFLGMAVQGPRGRTLVIPVQTIARVVPQLLAKGRIARGWLGVSLQPVEIPETLRAVAESTTALMVMGIAADGPAVAAGLAQGDILLSVDGRPTNRFRGIAAALGESIGRSVEIRFLRAGELRTLMLLVAERPRE